EIFWCRVRFGIFQIFLMKYIIEHTTHSYWPGINHFLLLRAYINSLGEGILGEYET
ncbi:hypothetical protein ACJX0J_039402, partial [Zea mays]